VGCLTYSGKIKSAKDYRIYYLEREREEGRSVPFRSLTASSAALCAASLSLVHHKCVHTILEFARQSPTVLNLAGYGARPVPPPITHATVYSTS
jgi:hypothetical protein